MKQSSHEPLISIIIPVYGTEQYLRKCLDSVMEQTYKNIEVIIVNDGTKDKSENIINEYLQEYDNIKYVRHTKNKGLFRARVSGAEEAQGKYIAFLDSDDYVSFDFYRLLIRKAEAEQCDIVVSNTVFEEINGEKNIRQLYQLCFEKDILEGDEIKDMFLSQSGFCFSWHTVWNKIYTKELWDKCFMYFKKMEQHLIMTEDIAFSSVLLYNARKLSLEYHSTYYYCKHPDASTNAENINFSKFEKNVKDLKTAFDFVDNFMKSKNASEEKKEKFGEFRKKYSRMYRSLQEYAFDKDENAKNLVDDFLPSYHKKQRNDEFCFDTCTAKFHNGLDYAKKAICDPQIKFVSFDVFDTLILRPFYYPTDLFDLMNSNFDEITDNSFNISFKTLRQSAEELAREDMSRSGSNEDVTLSEIYAALEKYHGISHDIAEKMKNLENTLELRFCTERKCGKELYDFANYVGKKIIITSDMYLEYDVVDAILKKNGFNKHELMFLSSKERALKSTGSLFKKLLKTLKIKPEKVLHIGDTWPSDIVAPSQSGIKTFFLPKARESFENCINGIKTNNSAWTEKFASMPICSADSARKSLGYRTMLNLVANKFFDNPFASFNENSDFNSDPKFLGYYALGMHCIGLSAWIEDISDMCGYKNVYFLARDGYLPMKIFDIYNKWTGAGRNIHYIHASRTLTLPLFIKQKTDLYDLPVAVSHHNPLSICKMISFCLNSQGDELTEKLSVSGFNPDKSFSDEKTFRKFIYFIISELYDENKLRAEQEKLKQYYSCIEDNSVLFDMGYSGRIQNAICEAIGKPIDAFYVHTDNNKSFTFSKKNGFKIHSLYMSVPESSDIIREYLLSDINPACCGIRLEDDRVIPVFETEEKEYPEKFIVRTMHNAAIEFINDFTRIFDGFAADINIVPQEVSYPFEYFLRFAKSEDRKFFSLCTFEDKCYGNIFKVRADQFFNNALCDLKNYEQPSDIVPLEKVTMQVVKTDDNEIEYEDDEQEEVFVSNKKKKSKLCTSVMFYDKIKNTDSVKESFIKCSDNTNCIQICESLDAIISTEVADNWYMNNEGVVDKNNVKTIILSNLSNIQPNQDITYLDKLLKMSDNKTILPVGIGFSNELSTSSGFQLSNDSVNTLASIAERCKSIGALGEYSADVLNRFGIKNVVPIGSTVLYQGAGKLGNFKNNTIVFKKLRGSFKPFYGKLSIKEKRFLDYLRKNEFVLDANTATEFTQNVVNDDKLFDKLEKYVDRRNIFFSIEEINKSFEKIDFVMGMNFYHNAAAVLNGVPAMFINYESCGKELCNFFNLPNIDISAFDDRKSVSEYCKMADYTEFAASFDKKFEIFCNFMEENEVSVKKPTVRVIEK